MKVILPNGTIAECNNPIVTEQWKKARYREVKPEKEPVEKKPVEKKPARRSRKKTK